ncbi:hypothetical protein STVA_05020 [Allostella vacuolata]|nr:hypothetical protein STVA_05020 [Stella vacuolata]
MARERLVLLLAPTAGALLAAAAGALADRAPVPALLAGGAAAAALAVSVLVARSHFDALSRLAGVLAGLAAGSGARAPPPVLEGAGDEVAAGYRAGLTLHASREQVRAEAAAAGTPGRLAQVVGALPQPVLVLTESGLVSLANGTARRLFGDRALVPGSSAFDAFDRDSVGRAMGRAQAAGGPVEATIETVEGGRLAARVAPLGVRDGVVMAFAPPAAESGPGWEAWLDHALDLHDRPPDPPLVDDRTPLADLPLAAFDTETTGLSPTRDRIVSVGGVRLHGARLYRGATLDRLVRPPVAIPATATAIHGITDSMLVDAPPIAAVLPAVDAFARGCVLVGHNIGFDLAVIEAEARRAGHAWVRPPALCLFQLADALDPGRTDLGLDELAARLAVPVIGRHTALGDALVAAEIYLRLLPRLAEAGVADWGGLTRLAARSRRAASLQAEAGW